MMADVFTVPAEAAGELGTKIAAHKVPDAATGWDAN
jgi:hypothetical protein